MYFQTRVESSAATKQTVQHVPSTQKGITPAVSAGTTGKPKEAIGPGFFSSPERTTYGQRVQSPTHLGMPNSQTAAMVGSAGQQASLTPPKPGFLPAAKLQPTSSTGAAAKVPPQNASLTATGSVINPASMAATPNTAAAVPTRGTSFKMNQGEAAPEQTAFGTKFIMTMPPGSSLKPKPPASLNSQGFTFGLSDGTNPSNINNPEDEEDDTLAGDDSYQGPDFEPIIPHLDEIDVTSEEEEAVLFSAWAKLFCFTESQWKERGLGKIKILHHKVTGRVRIVMHREQVHKVCANHSLSPEMTIKFKSPSEKKVLTWQAMDFADGQFQMEQLCAKFKSEDIALQFKEKFEEVVTLAAKKNPETKDNAAKLSEAHKTAYQFGTPASASFVFTFKATGNQGTPTFGSIGSQNVTTATTSSKTPEKAFGSNSNADIKTFGSLAGDDKSKPDAFSKKTDFKGFSGAGQQLFKSPNKSGKDDEGGADEEYEPDVDFKPIIPPPDLVAVETGEENEEKLFNSRVKLFRLDQNTKQWKERGIGEIKILKHKETSRCRLLMRREQVLKISCNQTISPNVKLQKMATSEKAWCWVAQDFSEGETKVEQFACKFKSPEVAQQFKEVYEAAALLKVKEPAVSTKPEKKLEDKSQPSLKEMFQPKPGAWQCDVCLVMNSNGEVCPACLTPKPGCAPPASTQSENVTSSGFKFGSGGGFTFGNKEAQDQPKSEKTSEAAAKPQPQSLKDLLASNDDSSAKPSEVSSTSGGGFKFGSSGAFTFGKSSDDKDSTDAPKAPFTFIPSGPSTEFVFGKSTPEKSGETPSHGFTFTPNKADSTVSSSTGSGFVFGKESTNTSFSFGGVTPSKPLDLSASKSPGVEDFYVNQDGEDSHIYFEPIIQLENMEVKTGEEEEEVLYSHRAKLFRFVDTEWKERGLGDVKILMHKKTQKRRILMRREQVHKISLNHYITPELNLMPMNNAQGKAWVWYAEDFVEGESSHEQLAIRFKTKDTADEFKEAFIKAQEEMKKYSTPTKAEEQAQSDKNTAKDAHAPSAKQSLVDKFAAKDGEWDCKACLVRNKADSTSCLACLTPKEGEQSGQVSSSSTASNPTFGGTPLIGSFSFKSPDQSIDPHPGKGFSFGSTPVFGAAKGFSFQMAGTMTGSISVKPAEISMASKGTSILASMLQEPSDKGKLQ